MHNNIDEVIAKVAAKLRCTVPEAAKNHNVPYASRDGKWVESPPKPRKFLVDGGLLTRPDVA